jgi:hypothetical protein
MIVLLAPIRCEKGVKEKLPEQEQDLDEAKN